MNDQDLAAAEVENSFRALAAHPMMAAPGGSFDPCGEWGHVKPLFDRVLSALDVASTFSGLPWAAPALAGIRRVEGIVGALCPSA